MKKIFILLASVIFIGCVPKSTPPSQTLLVEVENPKSTSPSEVENPKSTPQSEALLEEIYTTKSIIKVGVTYKDYLKIAQALQIKLDSFKRSEESKKIKYAGNLVLTAERYIGAKEKESGEDWSPNYTWSNNQYAYDMTQNCLTEDVDCYNYGEQELMQSEIITRFIDDVEKLAKQYENLSY